jgi:hypothetical protein
MIRLVRPVEIGFVPDTAEACRRARHRQGAAWQSQSLRHGCATADLDGVCARQRTERQVGAKEWFPIEQRNKPKAIIVPIFRDHDA